MAIMIQTWHQYFEIVKNIIEWERPLNPKSWTKKTWLYFETWYIKLTVWFYEIECDESSMMLVMIEKTMSTIVDYGSIGRSFIFWKLLINSLIVSFRKFDLMNHQKQNRLVQKIFCFYNSNDGYHDSKHEIEISKSFGFTKIGCSICWSLRFRKLMWRITKNMVTLPYDFEHDSCLGCFPVPRASWNTFAVFASLADLAADFSSPARDRFADLASLADLALRRKKRLLRRQRTKRNLTPTRRSRISRHRE